jgi:hypothetical protein
MPPKAKPSAAAPGAATATHREEIKHGSDEEEDDEE